MLEIYFYIDNYKKKTLNLFSYRYDINLAETFVESNNKRFTCNYKIVICRDIAIDFIKWRIINGA